LDESNRVVLVGNPLKNKRIYEMFHDIMKKSPIYMASPDLSENTVYNKREIVQSVSLIYFRLPEQFMLNIKPVVQICQ